MKRFVSACGWFVAPITGLLGGCTLRLGPLDDSDSDPPPEAVGLPAPHQTPAEAPVLDEAQRARKAETERYIAEVVYHGAPIVGTVALPSGELLDGLDRAWLPALPYETPPLPWAPEAAQLPPGVALGLLDAEQVPELFDLVATAAPFQRPTFWPYILGETDATSIEDYLDRYQVGGAPSRLDRLYAGLIHGESNRGVSGFMNQFRPEVAPGSFSLLEFAVVCPADGPPEELVGVAISVDKVNAFGRSGGRLPDGEPRLHIEYARLKNGTRHHVWDGADGQFVPNPFRRARPGQVVPVSALGGAQVEHLLSVFQVPTGDWWVAYQHELLGYYPAGLFSRLNGGACSAAWYGEVYRPDRAPGFENDKGAIKTEMGSGRFAEAGFGHAAYVRNPRYYDLLWFGGKPNSRSVMIPRELSCYSQSISTTGVASKDNTFIFLGGPGGNDPGCQWPSP
jgi:Neprosin